jgi:cytochrome c5
MSMPRSRLVCLALVLAACKAPAPQQAASGQAAADTTLSGLAPEVHQRLIASTMIGLPPAGFPTESLPDPTSRGAQLLNAYCTQCHALPSPGTHASQDWPATARRMWVRIDMMHGDLGVANPSEGDRTALINYLMANAFKVTDNLPAGAGKETFEAMCARCHLLPDPRNHSSADWPSVVMRMERNMERMRVRGLTNQQTTQIISYLQTATRR